MENQIEEFKFEVFDLPTDDVKQLLTTQDLKGPKILKINYQTIKYINTSYEAVIKSLMDLGYYKNGKDTVFSDCDYLIKYFPP